MAMLRDPMIDLTIGDIQRFHADLLSIRSAGVILDFGAQRKSTSRIYAGTVEALRSSLHQIETVIARETTRGKSIDSLIDVSESLSPQYIAALRTWQHTAQLPMSFEPIVATAEERQRRCGALRVSIVQPIVWVIFGYFAATFICLLTATSFLNFVNDLRSEPGPVLTGVLLVRSWMPVWLWLVPVIVIAAAWLLWNRKLGSELAVARRKTFHGAGETVRRANVADHTATLLQQGVSTEQAIDLLEKANRVQLEISELPPLLKWAANGQQQSKPASDTAETNSVQARMRFAANIYRGIAHVVTIQQLGPARPRFSIVLLGGVLVLGIALCVFGPLVELLNFVASSRGS